MKRVFLFVGALAVVFIMSLSNVFAGGEISIYLDGKELVSEQAPMVSEGTVYVPMRLVFEAFGFDVEWNGDKKRIKAKKADNNYIMVLQVNSSKVNICGNDDEIDKAPLIVNNRVLIPLRALSEKINAQVVWVAESKQVIITSPLGPITVSTARNFNYQNCESDDFWSDDTWNEKKFSVQEKQNQILHSIDDSEEFDNSDEFDEFSHNRHHFFDKNYRDFYDKDYKKNEDNDSNGKDKDEPLISDDKREEYEKKILELVNEERKKENLNTLTWNEKLAEVARSHSEDMVKRKFFSHTNPDGQSPFDRYKENGISYSYAAENIAAGNVTPEEAMNSWMNSDGHRANILNPDLDEIGVGLAFGGSYGYYWTQCFLGDF